MSAAPTTSVLPEPLARHSFAESGGSVARSYSVIHADPPWRYDDKLGNSPAWGAMKYPTMSVEELCALPVKEHAAKDCALLMWATWPLLPEALRVIEAWGFKYRTCAFVWVKQNPSADNGWLIRQDLKDALDGYSGLGKWVNGNTEVCLLAKRGSPKRQAKNVKQLVIAPRSRHSAKPPEVRDRIVRLFGDVPRLEMFARSKTPGWDVWGNELSNDVELVPQNDKLSHEEGGKEQR